MIAYLKNDTLKSALNANGINCWEVYIEEIFTEMGASAAPLSPEDLMGTGALSDISSLFIGSQSGADLDAKEIETLKKWVADGGMLLGCMTRGLNDVFGIEETGEIKESDEFTISGYFDLLPHEITRNIHPHLFLEQNLIILSNIEKVHTTTSTELSRLYDIANKETGFSAVTWNKYGKGFAGYFAFDVPKTIWILHQGRPLYGYKEEQMSPRTSEMFVLDTNSGKIPYADEIVFLIQNMLSVRPTPFIYQIPPKCGKVPDACIIWGGDEYFGPVELSLFTSDFMKEKGLPYHINIEIENHPITIDEYKHITEENGHEISLYYLLDDQNRITMERMKEQSDLFREKFGVSPGCCLINMVRWIGWAEPARWMAEAGASSVHSRLPGRKNLSHPSANSTAFSFNAGTGYPFYYYDDAIHQNMRISVMEQPAHTYELGHNGSTGVLVEIDADSGEHVDMDTTKAGVGDMATINFEDVHMPVDMAVKYHFMLHMFYHPLYIHSYPVCRKAIEEVLKYIDFLGANIYHMANNQAAAWWNDRAKSEICSIKVKDEGKKLNFISLCEHKDGMIVKMRLFGKKPFDVKCNGKNAEYLIRQDFGSEWIYITLPYGKAECEFVFA